MALSRFSRILIWERTLEYESLKDLMSGLLERSKRRAEEVSESKHKFDTAMEALTTEMESLEKISDLLDKVNSLIGKWLRRAWVRYKVPC
ncbi:hypothetical protein AAHA92_00655 [Salvia divinorum]|uniref:Uncharacterized protein n=1 Tax=Salvia divinorum TaxID=28513 RepID=A0ABD1IKB5_SALDI